MSIQIHPFDINLELEESKFSPSSFKNEPGRLQPLDAFKKHRQKRKKWQISNLLIH